MIDFVLKRLIGTKNQRELKRITPLVGRINELEPKIKAMRDDEFPGATARLKEQVQQHKRPLAEVLPEAFALTREAAVRSVGMRHFDVQLIGGAILHSGKIAEMKTGEGKTLVATLPCYLNALEGHGVHVVTVNDYLARRDMEWMGRIYRFLGMSVGCIVHDLSDHERREAYGADITYGQNNEFGFDYLRDNMKFRLSDYVQRELNFAIVDEVDSILIDEARTPLIISGPTEESTEKYGRIDAVIPGLIVDQDYTIDEKARSVMLTDEGVEKVEKRLGVGNLYDPGEIETLHHVEQGLRAHTLYKRDRDYVVKDGEVIIVDEFTGRLMPGRRWSDGLHQAIEAKEGVRIENENQTLATISFQNYFRMYSKLSGMTGTADTEAAEFADIYKLDVVVVPTNRTNIRRDHEDMVYRSEREKFNAVADGIEALHKKGQPVLVGTVSISKSEALAGVLKRRGIPHHVLNAKQHEREAEIIAQAGRKGSVTISTNMAGRGTDILLGGNPEFLAKKEVGPAPELPDPIDGAQPDLGAHRKTLADHEQRYQAALDKHKDLTVKEHEEVVALGGLFILGTERHESRRIDNQLRGRGGRQGDPGESRFYLSLEDDLMRIFGSERISGLMGRLGMEEGEPIEHKWLTRSIENAQKKVEGHNFDLRKHLLEYDDVMNQQRRSIYRQRREVLAAGAGVPLVEYEEDPKTKKKVRSERAVSWEDAHERLLDLFEDLIIDACDNFAPQRSPGAWDLEGLRAAVREQFNVEMSFAEDAKKISSREDLEEQIFNRVHRSYKEKLDLVSVERFRLFEQEIHLRSIDALWKDHLLAMDHLKQGIGLRGYGQKDPKQEYKKEGYEMFLLLQKAIRSSVVNILMRTQVAAADAGAELPQRRQVRVTETRGDGGGGAPPPSSSQKTVVREGPKVKPNQPCPCGSGKKYKKCHGAEAAA